MSLSICTSCLSRLRLSPSSSAPLVPTITRTSFHSSPISHGDGQQKKKKATGKNAYRLIAPQTYKKKKRVIPKLPPPGERRMLRKRIVLSNTNAYEIKGLEDLSVQNMGDEGYVGSMLGLEGEVLDQLRAARAFRKTQNWGLFRRPATLVRRETVEMGRGFEGVNGSVEGEKDVVRQVVDGERGAGKSLLVVQGLAMGYLNRWVVINVPEAQEFVINQSSYAPIKQSEGSEEEQMYTQPHLAAELLSRIVSSNKAVLQSFTPNHPLPQGIPFSKPPQSLHDITSFGAANPPHAHQLFTHLLTELTTPGTQPRPPTLIAIDGLNHWMGPTEYHAADHSIIHAHQFALIKNLLSLLFSNTPMAYGGMVLAATTKSNNPVYESLNVLLKQLSALEQGMKMTDEGFPMPTPYFKADGRVLSLLSPSSSSSSESSVGTTVRTLTGLSKTEAKGLLSYYSNSGILKDALTEGSVSEKWTLSSGGVIGELCKIGSRGRIDVEKVVTSFGTQEGVRRGGGEHVRRG